MFLTASELLEMTGYKRAAEQERWFQRFGIPCQRRRDGSLCVLVADLAHRKPGVESRPRIKSHRKAA